MCHEAAPFPLSSLVLHAGVAPHHKIAANRDQQARRCRQVLAKQSSY